MYSFVYQKETAGFSLIELLVVISIISLLAGGVLLQTQAAQEGSRDARRISDIRQFTVALELFYEECGHYPAPSASGDGAQIDIDTNPAGTNNCANTQLASFMSDIPTDPQQDSYQYISTQGGVSYCLGIDLADTNKVPQNTDAGCESKLSVNYAVSP